MYSVLPKVQKTISVGKDSNLATSPRILAYAFCKIACDRTLLSRRSPPTRIQNICQDRLAGTVETARCKPMIPPSPYGCPHLRALENSRTKSERVPPETERLACLAARNSRNPVFPDLPLRDWRSQFLVTVGLGGLRHLPATDKRLERCYMLLLHANVSLRNLPCEPMRYGRVSSIAKVRVQ